MFKIVRKDPFMPILGMFDEFLKNSHAEEIRSEEQENVSAMALDLSENAKEYRIIANLPGICKDDVKISLDKNQLVIEATHKKETEEQTPTYHHRERFFGKYRRQIHLPENVKSSNIKAKMENGVLQLTVPKEDEKPQTFITIE